jgi:ABC-2 type transport system ATP-binding protein
LAAHTALGVGDRLKAPVGDRRAAIDTDPIRPGRDRRARPGQPFELLAHAQGVAQLPFTQVGIRGRLGGMVVAVGSLVRVRRQIAIGQGGGYLRFPPGDSLQGRLDTLVVHNGIVSGRLAVLPAQPDQGPSLVTDAIVVEGLVREFKGGIRAVDGIDLHVRAGEVYGFLGPNGAGKSTTVRMLTTLLRPTGGTATVAGFDVVHEAASVRQAIGVALQDAAIDPFMTGRELLRLQATLHAIPRHEGHTRAEVLLDRVGLVDAADRRVGTYSGGMRRRLDLALALVHEPVVLFLDEPTTGLDPTSRVALWEEVRRLNRESGTTVFLTTQYLEEADQLAGRVGIIDGGKIVAEGTPDELKRAVGDATLMITPTDADRLVDTSIVLETFGRGAEGKPGTAAVRLPGGAAEIAAVVRALDQAGISTAAIELHQPSLDDVFVIKTGHRLEGDATAAPGSGRGRKGRE